MEMFDGPITSKNKSIQGAITNTKGRTGMNYVISVGLTDEEALILSKDFILDGPLPVGVVRLHAFINKQEYENLFHDCVVTVEHKFTYVQRVKTRANKELRTNNKFKKYI